MVWNSAVKSIAQQFNITTQVFFEQVICTYPAYKASNIPAHKAKLSMICFSFENLICKIKHSEKSL